jgi:hypothetical protein
MKRLSPSHELIRHRPALLVGEQWSVLVDDLLPELVEAGFHQIGRGIRVEVVNPQFVEFSAEEASLDGAGFRFREESLLGLDPDDPQRGLIAWQGDGDVQGMPGGPCDEFFGGIAPAHAEGRLEDSLSKEVSGKQQENNGGFRPVVKMPAHGGRFPRSRPVRKSRSTRRGFVLLEALASLTTLTVLGLVLLKLSLNILAPRQWIIRQTMTDAYLTFERALAERVPFDDMLAPGSPWPLSTATTINRATTANVEIGRLPGGVPVLGTVTRTRFADPNNLVGDGGTGTEASNPSGMRIFELQSVLTYRVGNRTYAKSRTVVRSQ